MSARVGAVDRTHPWVRCPGCAAVHYRKRLRRHLHVCPDCGRHERLGAPERVVQLTDPGTFTPLPESFPPVDPLGFVDAVPYPTKLAAARAATGIGEAVVTGTAAIGGTPLVLAAMDFRFLGGSLGTATGALLVDAAEHALGRRLPLLLVTASGGARMQEGALALMQMAAVSQAVAALREAGLLTISLITDPTYGGVAASFATCTDLIVVENGARMGFAGPRVIAQTIRQALPEGLQTAPFLLAHGQADIVADRRDLRRILAGLLSATTMTAASPAAGTTDHTPSGTASDRDEVLVTDPVALGEPDAWRTVRAARDTGRPTTLDYLQSAFDGFVELHGDRVGADCPAIVAGLARLGDLPVAVLGHQKGHRTADLLARNFGMASPAGHRKAVRVMRLAARLRLPVVTLIDTPGAHPGVDAERDGQAASIADSILTMTGLATPVVAVVTGEGGSGGALALAVADRVLMLQNSVYSVISPEGCAAILWHDPTATERAARALRLTAADLLRLGVVDAVVPEPPGGAHRDPANAGQLLRRALVEALHPLLHRAPDALVRSRRDRFRRFAAITSEGS